MSMSSDLGSMTHAEFVNAYGGPQEFEDFLEMKALAALSVSASGVTITDNTTYATIDNGTESVNVMIVTPA